MARRRQLSADRGGIAALEFALMAPFLVALVLGIVEVSLRVRAADTFQRYLYQAGDFVSRQDQLFTGDIDGIYAAAPDIMAPLDTAGRLDIDVASIGFIADGSPELLWRRERGNSPAEIDLNRTEGMGEPGESVIRVGATYRYTTPLSAILGAGSMTLTREVYFRPRLTRVIALDGEIHDAGANWTLDGQSTEGEVTNEEWEPGT